MKLNQAIKRRYIKMSASKKEKKVPALVDKPMDFCPGSVMVLLAG